MASLLYIKANPKSDTDSITFKMSEEFMAKYKEENPEDEIITLDLYEENIRFLSGDDLGKIFGGGDFDVRTYAEQFAAADKYVIAAPFWNLSIPAILKAYIDYVTYVNITFKYTAQGPVGLLKDQNKKLAYIVARGGTYNTPETEKYDNGNIYIHTIFGFMGITDVTTVSCESTGVLLGDELEKAVDVAVLNAGKVALNF